MSSDSFFGSFKSGKRDGDLTARTPAPPPYIHPAERRRLRQARINALERELGLPETEFPKTTRELFDQLARELEGRE